MMKRLAILIILAAVGWAGHWLWGKQTLMATYQSWFAERRAEGWQAEYTDMAIRGFPNRHDTTWEGLSITDPDSGLGWRAPFFQLFLLSYNRHHAIAIWPNRQVILTSEGEFDVTSESLRASLVTEEDAHYLQRANLVADVLNITDPDGATTALAQLRMAANRTDNATYDLAITAEGLALPAGLLRATGGTLPDTFSAAQMQVTVGFDTPWALNAPHIRPQPVLIDLKNAALEWGPMALRMTGKIDIDDAGRGNGEINLQARNWRDMLAIARASDQVPAVLLDGIETTLTLMSSLSGSSATLDATLRLKEGQIWLGLVPLGKAPRFVLR
ncbi:DUF2125 domain-containing protein [Marinovum sp. 2_MG-2023]|uniref:DUF2125 domain-containing protein n=1 Tax=unclassified Marinovum TaxID=2647166 RepID=UPI0026E26A14|nr:MULTISPECIES: DUF2125 domain-containing protein [unclassified Marinovum]MDO6732328.1 DUF2125 domain-containing protein [Marinovum sp. 2_MG-2023]MDO6781645.1 DUF2125 domain-containing protein [Marinovum sp. 1_MG-2023]